MGQQIKPNDAIKLCNNFDTKYNALSKVIGKEDNRSVLFTIKELKNYITYLEKTNENIDGLRVYLGSNGDTKLTTVFFASTIQGKDNTTLDCFNFGDSGIPPEKKYN